jgi:hypothetical protein
LAAVGVRDGWTSERIPGMQTSIGRQLFAIGPMRKIAGETRKLVSKYRAVLWAQTGDLLL